MVTAVMTLLMFMMLLLMMLEMLLLPVNYFALLPPSTGMAQPVM